MKRGCFLTTIIFGTIIIGTVFYVVDKHGNRIKDFFKDKVVELSTESADDYLLKLVNTPEKDSLKVLWNRMYNNARDMEFEEGMNYISTAIGKIDRYTRDSVLTREEFQSIKEFIKNER